MLNVFSNIFLSSFITVLWGIIFCRYFFNKKNQYNFNYAEYGFFGIILISFFSLFFNFFIELNFYITSIFFFPLLFFFNKEIFNKKKINKFFIYSLIFSIIGTILISYDNVYRPDAGRYHLPYTRILNDFKIFVGIANIDPFYGLSSIFQYTAAFYNNFLFNDTGVLLPLVLISIYFFNFLILEFLKVKNGNNIFYKLFIFFCGSFYFIEMNRYSNYGNDVPAQIFFFFLVSLILRNDFVKNNIDNFKIITLISIYCFLLRPFFIFSLIFPIYFWFKNYYFKKIKAVPFFALLFFTFWIIKNILITGCAIYPAKHTCLEKLRWYSDKPEYKVAAQNLGEFSKLHAKGWPDISNGEKYINYMNKREEKKNYLSDLNWISKENLENYLKLYFKKFDFFLSVTFLIFSISILFFYKKKQIIYEMNIPSNIKIGNPVSGSSPIG